MFFPRGFVLGPLFKYNTWVLLVFSTFLVSSASHFSYFVRLLLKIPKANSESAILLAEDNNNDTSMYQLLLMLLLLLSSWFI